MKKHSAIIVDDEQSARDILEGLLERFCPQIEVLAKCKDLVEGTEQIKALKPDLVFLDIEMPNYAGYEIVSFFDEIDFEIIFITAYDHYAIKAFEISAVDYLLKPIDIQRLKLSVARFEEKKELKGMQASYKVLQENLQKNTLSKILIPFQGEQKVLPIDEILAFEAKEAYASIHTKNGDRFMVSKNLKHFENLLAENGNFFRTHKSWLINMDFISAYSRSELSITLNDQLSAKLSKYKKADFDSAFNKN